MKILLRIAFIAASLGAASAAPCSELPGKWMLSIENPGHHAVATVAVEFTDEVAPSCMGGEWKVVKLVSATIGDKTFFPVSDPLSYRIEDGQLTIGRNEVCDAYLWLQGPLVGASVQGNYFSLGLGGSSPLGYFTLRRARPQ